MKITRIQVENFLGVQSVDVKPQTSITLFAGRNGSSKSSISEAVRMAICQDNVRDITKKNQFAALVHEGAKAGGAQVVMDDEMDMTFAFNMPKGDFTGPEIPESMRVALHGQRFAKMDDKERRTFLFGLAKLKPNAEAVKLRMIAKGCEEAKIDAVLPMLRTGFPACCDHAKSKATEEKGAWRTLTGETYGEKKAETWQSSVPEENPDQSLADKLTVKITSLDKNISAMNENLGAVKNMARLVTESAAKRAALAGSADKVLSITEQLSKSKDDLSDYEPTVISLRERAVGGKSITLTDELASFIATADIPALGAKFEDEACALLKRYEATGGDYGVAAGKVDTEAQAQLPEHEKGLIVMQNRVKNLQRDLDAALQEKCQYDALAPADLIADSSEKIAQIEGMLATARADRATCSDKLATIQAEIKAIADAETKTQDALKYHANVLAWSKVADALAPDGIPGEMLTEALKPVNTALEQAALDTDWMQVSICADMHIIANKRPYQLLSESEQWRVDAMIAAVVAELSGLKILMLDRVDVLDLPGRAQLFGWLDVLASEGIIDSALLFATLKALPTGLADTVESFWIEDGKIVMPKIKAAA